MFRIALRAVLGLPLGDFLPNTVYAKDTASLHQVGQGIAYLRSAALVQAFALLLVVAAFALRRLRRQGELVQVLAQVIVWAAYVVYVGGDALLAGRFWVPVLAPVCVLVQELVGSLWPRNAGWPQRFALTAVVTALFAFTLRGNFTGPELERIRYEGWVDDQRAAMGR